MKQSLLILFVSSIIFSCNSNSEDQPIKAIEYPAKFSLDGVDFKPSTYYHYLDNGLKEISVTSGIFSLFDVVLETEDYSDDYEWIAIFKEIELVSATEIRLAVFNLPDPPIDTILNYELIGDEIRIDVSTFQNQYILLLNSERTEIRTCISAYATNYFSTFSEEREISPIVFENCSYGKSSDDLLNEILETELSHDQFKIKDSLVFNLSAFEYTLE